MVFVRKIKFLPDLCRDQEIRLCWLLCFVFPIHMQVMTFETEPRAVQFNRASAEIGGKNGGKQ